MNDLLRDLAEILPPEIGVPEPAVEICHRQHHPIAVLGPVGGIIGDQRVEHFGRQLLRPHSFNFCLKLLGQIHLISSQQAQLQCIGKHIVKADDPRGIRFGGKQRHLKLPHLFAPLRIKLLVQLSGGLEIRFPHYLGGVPHKSHGGVEMSAEPAPAILIHQCRELWVE